MSLPKEILQNEVQVRVHIEKTLHSYPQVSLIVYSQLGLNFLRA